VVDEQAADAAAVVHTCGFALLFRFAPRHRSLEHLFLNTHIDMSSHQG
jgi:hypothetical protein